MTSDWLVWAPSVVAMLIPYLLIGQPWRYVTRFKAYRDWRGGEWYEASGLAWGKVWHRAPK